MSQPCFYKPAYAPEVRQQMVEPVAAGRRPKELAKECGCHETSISTWVRQSRAATPTLASLSPTLHESERAELFALRKEVRQLKVERDILSNEFVNRAAWFANKGEPTCAPRLTSRSSPARRLPQTRPSYPWRLCATRSGYLGAVTTNGMSERPVRGRWPTLRSLSASKPRTP